MRNDPIGSGSRSPDPDKIGLYSELSAQVDSLLSGEIDVIANLANAAAAIYHTLPSVNWAGFYLARGAELVLGPFQGKPACGRIPLGSGVCGTAAVDASRFWCRTSMLFPVILLAT